MKQDYDVFTSMTTEPAIEPGGYGSGSVLVVEDDRPTRELLGNILAIEGIRFQLTANGHEAMAAIRKSPPDMVVLDLHLPSVQGEAVGTALRMELGPSLPILAMSASFEQKAAERIGAFAFLSKPFELDDFLAHVRRGLDLSARSHALQRHSMMARERLGEAVERQRTAFQAALDRKRDRRPDAGAASR